MQLTDDQKARARAILRAKDDSFLRLLRLAGLDPALVLPGADLRGVVFTEDDDLTGLDLSGCDLRGTDLTQAKGLNEVRFADVVTDIWTQGVPSVGIPADFSILDVHTAILSGEVPPQAWWPFIRQLRFSWKRELSDLTPVAGLSALRHLDLSGTQVIDLTPIANLSALQHLDLDSTKIRDLKPIAGLGALQHLDLYRTEVTDLTPISGLSALRRLHLYGTLVSDLTAIAHLPSLQFLDLRGTSVIDLTPIANLEKLQRLRISAGHEYRGLDMLRAHRVTTVLG